MRRLAETPPRRIALRSMPANSAASPAKTKSGPFVSGGALSPQRANTTAITATTARPA
jgi:hypothetical protein